ncbi:MAG: iron-containing alcohol dehydrogenase [Nitrospinota bacterium]
MGVFSIRFPMRTWFGCGCVEKVKEEARSVGARHALILTDRGVRGAGIVDRVLGPLKAAGAEAEVFDECPAEPPIEALEACYGRYRKEAFDLVVGVGGGSSMDVGKSMGMLLGNGGEPRDYLGVELVPKPGLPTILIPTTAGTGAEATPNAIFTVKEEGVKKAIVSTYIIPRAAVVDPELTLTCPPAITAATGVDALTHCVESYVATNASPMSEMYSLEGIRLIASSLREAVANGANLRARERMALGSYYGGVGLTGAGAGAIHALAYPLGARFGISHGVSNALMFPHVMEFNCVANLEKYARVAEAMGEWVGGLSPRDGAARSVVAVEQICRDVGVPGRLREVNVPEEAIPELAEAALRIKRLLDINPRRVTREDIESLYRRAA